MVYLSLCWRFELPSDCSISNFECKNKILHSSMACLGMHREFLPVIPLTKWTISLDCTCQLTCPELDRAYMNLPAADPMSSHNVQPFVQTQLQSRMNRNTRSIMWGLHDSGYGFRPWKFVMNVGLSGCESHIKELLRKGSTLFNHGTNHCVQYYETDDKFNYRPRLTASKTLPTSVPDSRWPVWARASSAT